MKWARCSASCWANKKKDAPAPEETPETAQAAQTEAEAEVETAAEAAQEQQAQSAEQKLQDALAKIEEYLNLAQRVQADFDNYRKRTKATRAEAFEDGAREVVKQLLPVVDNLERAIAQESADDALHAGVKLVYRQLMDTLEKRGVSELSRAGDKFDPNLENAVMQGDATVCAVLQKGYKMGYFVLRHAMVKVVAE